MQFDGQALSTGTAFVVSTPKGPYLITNRHNVTGRNQETDAPLSKTGGVPNLIVIFHNQKGLLGRWVPRLVLGILDRATVMNRSVARCFETSPRAIASGR